jgi:predicted SAM-dependent methyltransferase
VLFGDQDYPDNAHKNYLNPMIVTRLLQETGFGTITTTPYGDAKTDMIVEAIRPVSKTDHQLQKYSPLVATNLSVEKQSQVTVKEKSIIEGVPREELFGKDYFNGGGKYGGYAREGYWDYPVHEVTANHVLARKPESVLEIGCGRGYILKRIQDAGIPATGLEISKHCWMTRVASSISILDLCNKRWPVPDQAFDLCLSVAVLEHIPEEHLPFVISEMERTCKRGLHGIDFGEHDDGFDKTHCTLKNKSFWSGKLPKSHEVLDKEELERGDIPEEVLLGDGKMKLNIGSYTTMVHHGWTNIDIVDLKQWATHHRYKFLHHDVKNGLPYGTGTVDYLYSSHFLEHLTFKEGLTFLKECRRVIKPEGVMRFLVPDAKLLTTEYLNGNLSEFDEINDGCAESPTAAGKLWALLHEGHFACYDSSTLTDAFHKAGFNCNQVEHRESILGFQGGQQILKETLDMLPCLTLYMEAWPS